MNRHVSGRNLTLAAMFLLGFWLLLWLGFLARAGAEERALWLSLAMLPLIIVGLFVFGDYPGGYAWCGFLSLGYFAQGTTVLLTSHESSMAGAVEILFSMLLFTSAAATLRARHHRR